MNYNKWIGAGNLTRDPELRYTPKGTAVCSCAIAINRYWTGDNGEKKEEVTFVEFNCMGRTAENLSQYMRKGRPVHIEGRLRLEQWEDKKTGQNRSRLVVVAESIQFVGGKSEDDDRRPASNARRNYDRPPAPRRQPPPEDNLPPDSDYLPEEDDVPF